MIRLLQILFFGAVLLSYSTKLCAIEDIELSKGFRKQCAELSRDAERNGCITVVGREGWLFLAPELRHIGVGLFWGKQAAQVSKAVKSEYADPLPAILDFSNQLKSHGIELLMVIVPPKAVIYSDYLPGAKSESDKASIQRLDQFHQNFYDILRANGIELLDLTELFMEQRFSEKGALYCQQDSHFSGTGCMVAAKAIAKRLKERAWFNAIAKERFSAKWRVITYTGDLLKGLRSENSQKEHIMVRRISREKGSSLEPIASDPSSPIILLGDSHTLVFHAGGDMHAKGAGLADQIAYELGVPVDIVGVRGSGATPARINLFRRAKKDKHYWQNKRIVLWCFSAREFTESDGWRKIPTQQPKEREKIVP